MRCIFCKRDSSESSSIEHVIPESLGNSKLTIPKGSVCDSCNNYFATHLEKQILESEEFSRLRFNQELKNKKGRVPEIEILMGDHVVKARRLGFLEFGFRPEDFDKIEKLCSSSDHVEMKIPLTGKPPNDALVSRWLAKMALEIVAYKWLNQPDWNDYLIEHEGFDPIRKFARAPNPGEVWEYSKRRIYADDEASITSDMKKGQMIYECDILATGTAECSELFFVVAFFGMEYAINLGGSSMQGYFEWLKRNNDISPLYSGKNSPIRPKA